MKRFLVPMIVCGCAQVNDLPARPPEGSDGGGGGCGQIELTLPLSASQVISGSYAGRSFLSDEIHVGNDMAASAGTPVKAILPGRIVYYGPARGYGELVVVTEHDLGEELPFVNGRGETIYTRYILIISGHLRKSETRSSARLTWRVGDFVEAGDVIGYVNDDAHNGDGAEHVHFGVRLSSASEAQAVDPRAWFRGYDTASRTHRGDFADVVLVIAALEEHLSCDGGDGPTIEMHELDLTWQAPAGIYAEKITLTGRILRDETEVVSWREWKESNGQALRTTLALDPGESFEFSIEYEDGDALHWSCEGNNTIRGQLDPLWDGSLLQAVPIPNGVGGCNLHVSTDGPYGETVVETGDEGPGAGTMGVRHISCALDGSDLLITTSGPLSTGLYEGPISGIAWLSLGSNANGWATPANVLPTYYAIWNGDSFEHTLRVPAAVNRFNLWVSNILEVRWLDLRLWTASGAGCRVNQEGDGYIVIR